jgi:hypothetical protein
MVEACIGLAVPGRPIRSLVAENRSAGGVRNQTGPEPQRSVLGPHGTGSPGLSAVTSGHDGYAEPAGQRTVTAPTWAARGVRRRVRIPAPPPQLPARSLSAVTRAGQPSAGA